MPIATSEAYRVGMTEALRTLRQGGILVLPTDTVYGLAADATNDDAVRRLFRIKNRPPAKPVPVFVSSVEMAKTIAYVDQRTERALEQVWPGAVIVILSVRSRVAPAVTAGGPTVGVRLPDHPVPVALVEKLGRPIVGASANITGEPPRHSAVEVLGDFRHQLFKPDLVLDLGRLEDAPPSTVLDLTSSSARVVRAGPVSKEMLVNILRR
ncbi:threonylcarbamoyl-AMP synthase [Candidatus Parcubacteria bacterium]|nr:threonylcarbamoyl-AMP synthase [Candidatus Parcubacteria bacterium]